MIQSNQKTSLLVPYQLPEFIRDNPDYSNFVLFLQAYYEWLEQSENITDQSKNLMNYMDVDSTSNEFLDYFTNTFLPYFPKDVLIDKNKALKFAKELYQTKGTMASYKLLFKVLYNSEFDVFYTKDAVLKASSGTWYIPKSLKVLTTNENWRHIKNLRVFGETTKSFATIENSVLAGDKTEIFISNIERLFHSGETLRIVDENNQDVYFLNGQKVTSTTPNAEKLTAKLVGQISQINIDPNQRGLLYEPGYPVVVHGGLSSDTGYGATAEVGTTTSGSVQRINVLTGGHGYREYPNTIISFTNLNSSAREPIAKVGSVDPAANGISLVNYLSKEIVSEFQNVLLSNTNYHFSNIATSNVNTIISEALSFDSFLTYPLSSVIVENGGGGISAIPKVSANSLYTSTALTQIDISTLGILGPIQITDGGVGYEVGDTIVITGGTGVGAAANVHTVNSSGSITSVQYIPYATGIYPLGGMGYNSLLPTITVDSANVHATGASLYVPGILGTGANFSTVTDRAGSITTINVTDYGQDYIETPNVSLKVMDIVVTGVDTNNLPTMGQIAYQGDNAETATFFSYFDSLELLSRNDDPTLSIYNMRVYDYNSYPNPSKTIHFGDVSNFLAGIDDVVDNPTFDMAGYAYIDNEHMNSDGSSVYNSSGFRIYGDGNAKATAKFLNGLTVGAGQYLNSHGQPSSFSVLQSQDYNNFTYQITVEKEIAKYRSVLLNLLHPTGTKVLGRYAMKANADFSMDSQEAMYRGNYLYYYTNDVASNAVMTADFTTYASNTITFNNIGVGTDISTFITTDSIIQLTTYEGPNVRSKVKSVDAANNKVTIDEYVWLTVPNVATITANAGENTINITELTGSYDIVNNGNYSNTSYPLMDIVYPGDKVKIANNSTLTVESVDYENGIITVTSNLSQQSNSLMSVNRTLSAGGTLGSISEVTIFGAIGTQYYPELTTEDGYSITTEDGRKILLG